MLWHSSNYFTVNTCHMTCNYWLLYKYLVLRMSGALTSLKMWPRNTMKWAGCWLFFSHLLFRLEFVYIWTSIFSSLFLTNIWGKSFFLFFFFQNTVWSVQILVPAGCLWGKQSFSKAVTQPGPLRSAVCVWHQVTWPFSYFSSLRGNYISQWRNYPCIVSDSMNMLRPSDVSAVFFSAFWQWRRKHKSA